MASHTDIAVTALRPSGWVDKTMIVYAAPADPAKTIAPNMVVARDALGASETFREYCNRQIDGFCATLPHFHREEEGPGQVHGHDAFQILFNWTSGAGTLRQRVFFISAGHGVVVTFTATAALDDFADQEGVFQQGLAGLTIGRVS